MKDEETYTDWNFIDIWNIDPEINDGYPYLFFAVPETYIDIGLRVFNGNRVVAIACETSAGTTSPLRVAKDTDDDDTPEIFGVALVEPGDSAESGVRIQTSSGIKALREF